MATLPDETVRRHALREVVRRCIFGVDRNPLSVELCKTALWIEAIEPGKPLTFLDAHIKSGDSLIGVADLSVLKSGIPDEAFKELAGDDKSYVKDLRKRNKGERENPTLTLLPEVALPPDLAAAIAALTDAPEETLAAVDAKRRALANVQAGRASHDLRVACDLWCAAFFVPRLAKPEMRGRDLVPTTDTVWRYLRSPSSIYPPVLGVAEELRDRLRFFHWQLEFPEAFAAGGFDCILGNPPWERINLEARQFFATSHPDIATAKTSQRRKLLAELKFADPTAFRRYELAKRDSENETHFFQNSGRYQLINQARINTYSLFVANCSNFCNKMRFTGIVVPTGVVTDDISKKLFEFLIDNQRIVSLYDFENSEPLFAGVHRSYKFSIITLSGSKTRLHARFAFSLRLPSQIQDERRVFSLDRSELQVISPMTGLCPTFRSAYDKQLILKIYGNFSSFIWQKQSGVDWEESDFLIMFRSDDSDSLYRTFEQFDLPEPDGVTSPVFRSGEVDYVPVWEAKLIHQFDHRFASFEGVGAVARSKGDCRLVSNLDKNTTVAAVPRFWVARDAVLEVFAPRGWRRSWTLGYRDITNAGNERTSIAACLPDGGAAQPLNQFLPESALHATFWLASMNSIILDYVARQRISGVHLNITTCRQLPIIGPKQVSTKTRIFVSDRVLELTYTSLALRDFADDLGYRGPPFRWDDDRRAHLRADLDAAYAHLYGLTRDELRYILEPADIYGPDFPSETFRGLKEKEIRQYGEYRTARLVLAAWDRLTSDGTFKSWQA